MRGQMATLKTREQIEELKENWYNDQGWDFEDTPGFEAHKDELRIFRLETELAAANEERRQREAGLQAFAKVIAPHVAREIAANLKSRIIYVGAGTPEDIIIRALGRF